MTPAPEEAAPAAGGDAEPAAAVETVGEITETVESGDAAPATAAVADAEDPPLEVLEMPAASDDPPLEVLDASIEIVDVVEVSLEKWDLTISCNSHLSNLYMTSCRHPPPPPPRLWPRRGLL